MKKIKISVLIIILIALATITTVNAAENVTDDLISQTQSDEILQSDDEYINNNQNLEFKLNVSADEYETTGNLTFNVYYMTLKKIQ